MKLPDSLQGVDPDRIVCVYAQNAAGPGWANTPLYVVYRDYEGNLRETSLQPKEQPFEVSWMYTVASAVHRTLIASVQRMWLPKVRRNAKSRVPRTSRRGSKVC